MLGGANGTPISKLSGQVQTLEQSNTRQLQQIAEIENQRKGSESRAEEYQAKLKSLEEKHAVTIAQSKSMADEAKSSSDESNSLKMTLERTVGRLESTEIALKKAEDSVANLSHKNLFLVQETAELKAQLKQWQSKMSV